MDLESVRVDAAQHVFDRSALAAGVHALEHQQHASRAPAQALGEQALLVIADLGNPFRERLLCLALAVIPARGGCRINSRKLGRAGRAQFALDAHRLTHAATLALHVPSGVH